MSHHEIYKCKIYQGKIAHHLGELGLVWCMLVRWDDLKGHAMELTHC